MRIKFLRFLMFRNFIVACPKNEQVYLIKAWTYSGAIRKLEEEGFEEICKRIFQSKAKDQYKMYCRFQGFRELLLDMSIGFYAETLYLPEELISWIV